MGKPSISQLDKALAEGLAVEVTVEVKGVMLADGRTYWPDSERKNVYDDHAEVHGDGGVYTIGPRSKGLKKLGEKLRRGAGSLLRLLDSPVLSALVPAGTLAKVRRIASVAQMPPKLQLAAIIQEVDDAKLSAIWDVVEKAGEDGEVSEEELATIIALAKELT